MIRVFFFRNSEGMLRGFKACGHAGFSDYGTDIVCAGMSSAISMCCNGLLCYAKKEVFILVKENDVKLRTKSEGFLVQAFLNSLLFQINLIKNDYPKNVMLNILEVL